jgi:hypothetical protein
MRQGRWPDVVDKPAAAGQQAKILPAANRLPDALRPALATPDRHSHHPVDLDHDGRRTAAGRQIDPVVSAAHSAKTGLGKAGSPDGRRCRTQPRNTESEICLASATLFCSDVIQIADNALGLGRVDGIG